MVVKSASSKSVTYLIFQHKRHMLWLLSMGTCIFVIIWPTITRWPFAYRHIAKCLLKVLELITHWLVSRKRETWTGFQKEGNVERKVKWFPESEKCGLVSREREMWTGFRKREMWTGFQKERNVHCFPEREMCGLVSRERCWLVSRNREIRTGFQEDRNWRMHYLRAQEPTNSHTNSYVFGINN